MFIWFLSAIYCYFGANRSWQAWRSRSASTTRRSACKSTRRRRPCTRRRTSASSSAAAAGPASGSMAASGPLTTWWSSARTSSTRAWGSSVGEQLRRLLRLVNRSPTRDGWIQGGRWPCIDRPTTGWACLENWTWAPLVNACKYGAFSGPWPVISGGSTLWRILVFTLIVIVVMFRSVDPPEALLCVSQRGRPITPPQSW